MPTDIVLPDNNEHEFIDIAKRLGYTRLIFAYDYSRREMLKKKIRDKDIDLHTALLADKRDIRRAKQLSKVVIARSTGDDRETIEKLRPNIIYGLEAPAKKDSLHFRNSGLNHILCAILDKNSIKVALSFSMLLNAKGTRRSVLMGRMSQNIRLCRKYKVRLLLASFARNPYHMRPPHDLKSLAMVLGMDTGQSSKAFTL
jgi:RNase P/RNase MRP subunit p30